MGNHDWVLLSQVALTWMLVGVILYMQLIHYPLFIRVKEGFHEYERSHIRRTACLIGPMMLLEGVGAAILVGLVNGEHSTRLAVINLVLVCFIWLTTFLLTIYQHQKLSVRFSKRILKALISTNWIRVILWIVKGCVVIALIKGS